jgi:hypothetical protein
MKNFLSEPFGRRSFMAGAGALAGISLMKTSALGGLSSRKAPLALHYWDGEKFLPADKAALGDPSLTRVRVLLRGIGGPGLRRLDALFTLTGRRVPKAFHAWTSGGGIARFEMPVADGAVRFRAVAASGEWDITLRSVFGAGNKLREGSYALVGDSAVLLGSRLSYQGTEILDSGDEPLHKPHLLINIERA